MPNDYSKRLKDPRWQRKRLDVMERDNFTCRDTGATDEPLNVHHCWYAKGGPWETPSEYMLTLTEEAHERRQQTEARAKQALGGIMASLPPAELEKLTNQLEEARYDADTQGGESPVIMGIGRFNWTADEAWWSVLEPEIGRDRLREITGTVEVTKAGGPSDG